MNNKVIKIQDEDGLVKITKEDFITKLHNHTTELLMQYKALNKKLHSMNDHQRYSLLITLESNDRKIKYIQNHMDNLQNLESQGKEIIFFFDKKTHNVAYETKQLIEVELNQHIKTNEDLGDGSKKLEEITKEDFREKTNYILGIIGLEKEILVKKSKEISRVILDVEKYQNQGIPLRFFYNKRTDMVDYKIDFDNN